MVSAISEIVHSYSGSHIKLQDGRKTFDSRKLFDNFCAPLPVLVFLRAPAVSIYLACQTLSYHAGKTTIYQLYSHNAQPLEDWLTFSHK